MLPLADTSMLAPLDDVCERIYTFSRALQQRRVPVGTLVDLSDLKAPGDAPCSIYLADCLWNQSMNQALDALERGRPDADALELLLRHEMGGDCDWYLTWLGEAAVAAYPKTTTDRLFDYVRATFYEGAFINDEVGGIPVLVFSLDYEDWSAS
jgi:hypothetical protein